MPACEPWSWKATFNECFRLDLRGHANLQKYRYFSATNPRVRTIGTSSERDDGNCPPSSRPLSPGAVTGSGQPRGHPGRPSERIGIDEIDSRKIEFGW